MRSDSLSAPRFISAERSYVMPLVGIDPSLTIARRTSPPPIRPISSMQFIALYGTGVWSFVALCFASFASQLRASGWAVRADEAGSPYVALIGTTFFVVATARYFQREILIALTRSFDFWFLSLQSITAALLLGDLYRWDERWINVVSWTVWFHWVLLFDALTPWVRQYLYLKKVSVAPVLLFALYSFTGAGLVLYGVENNVMHERVIWGHARVRTDTFFLGRVLTLWLWSLRLFGAIGVGDEEELVLVRDLLELAVDMSRSSEHAVVPMSLES
ncbi:hypothetical protein P43SY_005908 [Pythium insidiosum]|uniref:Uncharacterized protein n=1 Tax=Pythium insidiosum TaxID=114742 RepID=A0AAD5LM92_PYTIN|nr:hypothetical protein P43SY_005908 [Pythium insidiosum]